MKDLKEIPYLSKDNAKVKIIELCNLKDRKLQFLGEGHEGFVFSDKNFVYKIFKPSHSQDKLYFNLNVISYALDKLKFTFLYPFEVT